MRDVVSQVHRPVDRIDNPFYFRIGITRILGVAFLADAARLRKVVEQDAVNEGLAFLIGGQLDVVGVFGIDGEMSPESVAEAYAGGLRGGDGGINHPASMTQETGREKKRLFHFTFLPAAPTLVPMVIPLEDSVTDIIGKAQRGLGLSDSDLADRIGIEIGEVEAVKLVKGVAFSEVEKMAAALKLGPRCLVALADGKYTPTVTLPKTGFFQSNTTYGDMTVNSYLVWDESTKLAAAFDTGADAMVLIDEIKKRGLTLQDVYLTHTHVDHIVELDRLLEKAGGSVGVHVNEAEPIEGAATFKPGVTFSLGKLHIESRDTSGHSAGGTTFHIHGLDAPLAIVGDALFAGSVGGIKADYAAALQKIRDNILSAQDNTILAPGHGPLTTVAQEKASNPFFPEFRKALAEDI